MDVFIILLTLSVIALGIYLFFPEVKHIDAETANATFTVTITNCDANVTNAFKEAFLAEDEQTNTPKKLKVGERELTDAEILEYEITPSSTYVANNQTKELIQVTSQQTWDIKLVLKANVTETDEAFILGNSPLRVGSEITVMCQKASGIGSVEKMITYY